MWKGVQLVIITRIFCAQIKIDEEPVNSQSEYLSGYYPDLAKLLVAAGLRGIAAAGYGSRCWYLSSGDIFTCDRSRAMARGVCAAK